MSVSGVHRLVLWDIDHTLVNLAGLGRTWYDSALRSFGTELHTHPDYAGRTERAITADVLITHNIEPSEENIQRLWKSLIQLSEESRATLHESGRALDGAEEAINELDRIGVVQTVVTGNLPEISLHKLAAFGLDQHLDLEIGGYGTISAQRADLVAYAIDAASEKYSPFARSEVVVVGDTPKDVQAALDNQVVAVAVATGNFTADQLTAAGAHTVLADLTDLDAVRTALLGR